MRNYDYSKHEQRLVETDEVWSRMFARLHPHVRKDFVGWLQAPAPPVVRESRRHFVQWLQDVAFGAASVVNLLPGQAYHFYEDDADALNSDISAVSRDAFLLGAAVRRGVTNALGDTTDHERRGRDWERAKRGKPRATAE